MKRILTALAISGLLVACGTSTTPTQSPPAPTSTSVNGTIEGHSVVAGATLGLYGLRGSSSSSPYAGVFIANSQGFSDWCPALKAGDTAPPSTTLLWLQVSNVSGNDNAVPPGTYALGLSADGNYATVGQFIASDSNCNEVANVAPSGSVTLDTVSTTTVAGTFDLEFGSDHVTGQFAGSVCNVNLTMLGMGDGGGCSGDAGDQ